MTVDLYELQVAYVDSAEIELVSMPMTAPTSLSDDCCVPDLFGAILWDHTYISC